VGAYLVTQALSRRRLAEVGRAGAWVSRRGVVGAYLITRAPSRRGLEGFGELGLSVIWWVHAR
jgi:hypothetical protein